MTVTMNDILDQRIEMQETIGREKTVRLMNILDKSPCPFCFSHNLFCEGFISITGLYMFRFNCRDCGSQYIPNQVEEFGGFGVI